MTSGWTGTGTVSTVISTARTQIENKFGANNIAKWSNLSGGNTADTNRIAQAVAWAKGYVDNRFRPSRYTVPLTDTTDVNLINWLATLGGTWLYENKGMRDTGKGQGDTIGDKMQDLRDDINTEIAEFLSGQRKFGPNMGIKQTSSPGGPVVIP